MRRRYNKIVHLILIVLQLLFYRVLLLELRSNNNNMEAFKVTESGRPKRLNCRD